MRGDPGIDQEGSRWTQQCVHRVIAVLTESLESDRASWCTVSSVQQRIQPTYKGRSSDPDTEGASNGGDMTVGLATAEVCRSMQKSRRARKVTGGWQRWQRCRGERRDGKSERSGILPSAADRLPLRSLSSYLLLSCSSSSSLSFPFLRKPIDLSVIIYLPLIPRDSHQADSSR